MSRSLFFAGAAVLLLAPGLAQAQAADSGSATDPSAIGTPADPAPTPAAESPAAPVTASVAEGVTKEGGKFMKDGRKATKVEIAEYKKAVKGKHE